MWFQVESDGEPEWSVDRLEVVDFWVLIFQFYNHSKYESDAESDAELDAESDAD